MGNLGNHLDERLNLKSHLLCQVCVCVCAEMNFLTFVYFFWTARKKSCTLSPPVFTPFHLRFISHFNWHSPFPVWIISKAIAEKSRLDRDDKKFWKHFQTWNQEFQRVDSSAGWHPILSYFWRFSFFNYWIEFKFFNLYQRVAVAFGMCFQNSSIFYLFFLHQLILLKLINSNLFGFQCVFFPFSFRPFYYFEKI